ncbi:sugar transferase [Hymenobacter coccineus]|uniref:Bacterial sugar transferase domain-containing protein n=1 Tax=Hymenobacter coccineus TaxID=1908235 RepID=A0A1G1THF9_9BACT|nr:sugar transferase [Hymenobacter coccineus]OGX90297.1 hypothetical protein BEN49_06985 [Hymenobacter coccineus]
MILYERRTQVNQMILLAADVLLIFGAFRFVEFHHRGDWQFGGDYPLFFAVFALLWWIVAGQVTNPTSLDRLTTYSEKFWALVLALLIHAVVLTAGILLLQVRLLPIRYIVLLYAVAGTAVVSGRLLVAFFYRTYRYRLARPHSRFVIVGASRSGREMHQFLTLHDPVANQFLGFFTDEPVSADLQPLVRGGLADLKNFCEQEQVDEMYFAMPLNESDLISDLSTFADDHFMAFRILPDFEGTLHKGVNVHYHGRGPILTVRRHPLAFRTNQIAKRGFDLVFSGLVIVGVFPILLPILALIIKLDSPGPVFFKQMRPGKRNKLFPCYKLRSMSTTTGGTELQATKGDARVTRVGRFLRSSSLDEIPQFFNVWLGHMSVVGPTQHGVAVGRILQAHSHLRPAPRRDARHHGPRPGERPPRRNPRRRCHGEACGVRPGIRGELVAAARYKNHRQDGVEHGGRREECVLNSQP